MRLEPKAIPRIKFFGVLIGIMLLAACASNSTWTANEIIEWHSNNVAEAPELYSPLYYQGSDEGHHYFAIRAIDRWMTMKVGKKNLKITDQRPLVTSSSDNYLGYYAVDPQDEFRKIEDR